jgi:hypothetical protein
MRLQISAQILGFGKPKPRSSGLGDDRSRSMAAISMRSVTPSGLDASIQTVHFATPISQCSSNLN